MTEEIRGLKVELEDIKTRESQAIKNQDQVEFDKWALKHDCIYDRILKLQQNLILGDVG